MHRSLAPVRLESETVVDERRIDSPAATEIYLTVTSRAGTAKRQAEEIYSAIAARLHDAGAHIVSERLFASGDAMAIALETRYQIYGPLNDGVRPTLLLSRDVNHEIAGVQLHAIAGIDKPKILYHTARQFDSGDRHYLTASGLCAPRHATGAAQTTAAFHQAQTLLAHAGASMQDVARTWIWMDDILSWYPDLNRARTDFFKQCGLLSSPGQLPASTGIGISPARGKVAIDLFAAWGTSNTVTRFHSAGHQRSAYEYGSAFARAARVLTPAGPTIFFSGTAAIDAAGATCFVNDIPGQIDMTLENIQAVLGDLSCDENSVLHALAYCKNREVVNCFNTRFRPKLNWPCLTLVADVCRDDLLFEVEVTASPNTIAS